ncbi:hypothetical protein BH18GEM1_BH18GEM1_01930 [soil metagenome]
MSRARLLQAGVALVAALAAGCSDDSRSPVGVDLLPGGALGGELQIAVLRDVERAEDYAVFPAARGTADRLVTALQWPFEPGFESRALFRFSLASIDSLPDGIRITDSALHLAFGPAPEAPVTFRVHRLTSGWTEDAATWDRRDFGLPWAEPGGDFDPAPVAEFTIQPTTPDSADSSSMAGDSIRVPLPTSVIDAWLSGAASNDGLILVQVTPGAGVEFAARSAEGIANPLGPRLEVEVLLPDPGSPAFETRIPAAGDTFIAIDRGSFPPGGLTVSAGGDTRRVFILPSLDSVPEGTTVVEAALIFSVDEARVASDSLRLFARSVLDEFRGEKTILSGGLGLGTLAAGTTPDSIVFKSTALTESVREWLRNPESNRGIVITVLDESTVFGGVSFFGPEGEIAVRPRLRLVLIPPSTPGDSP